MHFRAFAFETLHYPWIPSYNLKVTFWPIHTENFKTKKDEKNRVIFVARRVKIVTLNY